MNPIRIGSGCRSLPSALRSRLPRRPPSRRAPPPAVGGRVSSTSGQAGCRRRSHHRAHADPAPSARATTDADGRYTARGLRVGGPYTITITKDGETQTREDDVYLQLEPRPTTSTRRWPMRPLSPPCRSPVDGGSDVFSPTKMGAGTNVDPRDDRRAAVDQPQHPGLHAPRPARGADRQEPRRASPPAARTRASTRSRIDGVRHQRHLRPRSQQRADAERQPVSMDAIEELEHQPVELRRDRLRRHRRQ